jgi:hypothetical protein
MGYATRRLTILFLAIAATGAVADAAAASGAAAPTAAVVPVGPRMLDATAAAVIAALAQDPAPAAPAPSRKRSARRGALRGVLIGAGAGAALTVFAAAAEGENEGGGFCVQCLVEWGTIVIPISAGVGAGIGAAIGVMLPARQPGSWTPGPGPRRRGAAVGVSLRF